MWIRGKKQSWMTLIDQFYITKSRALPAFMQRTGLIQQHNKLLLAIPAGIG